MDQNHGYIHINGTYRHGLNITDLNQMKYMVMGTPTPIDIFSYKQRKDKMDPLTPCEIFIHFSLYQP